MYIVVGLGNPGDQYAHTRHNTGRLAIEYLEKKELSGVKSIHLDTFMNKSGVGVAKIIKSKKAAQKLIVIYDDLDLGLGTMKISYNRSSGGHRGVESIIRALKTEEFIRIRIGISPATPSGKLKKPKGDKDVEKHILGDFKKPETETLKKVFKKVSEAVSVIAESGLGPAMTEFNS
ncbi:MAG: aminoacyl-tRNA hydrolase, partial [Minisyncoccia bacterium]